MCTLVCVCMCVYVCVCTCMCVRFTTKDALKCAFLQMNVRLRMPYVC